VIDKLRNAVARHPGSVLTMLAILVLIATIVLLGRPATLTIAVAPSGGTEPALMRAFAAALEEEKAGIRLRIVSYPGVVESAAALERREVDLAVVRPDVAMPVNGLTLAVLRELAALVVVPGKPMSELSELGGKRLAILANRSADPPLFQKLVGHAGLDLRTAEDGRPVTEESVALVTLDESDLAAALREKRVDAVAVLTTPTTAAAERVIAAARDAAAEHEAQFLALPDVQALVARFPRLQSVTIPAGLFGGDPKLPAEEMATIGASHRLMARPSLSRSRAAEVTQRLFEMRARLAATVPAADDMTFPPYEDTAGATTARMPIHPGALDYFEREQESFIERYESFIYLVAILGGSVVSMFAWLRTSIGRARRERINVATARLLKLRSEAGRITDPEKLARMQEEVDSVAASIARHALRRRMESPAIEAAAIAVAAARETIRRATERARATG
jgi:TRAP-type uncharacterized transport system substrate-binding protein